mmetsp:Transcript_10355/g.30285  ORF Transcript_10355/g.30285 Transcript_10355/m.30285 type:complete len:157 (+) Transcript_10355:100-570(+)
MHNNLLQFCYHSSCHCRKTRFDSSTIAPSSVGLFRSGTSKNLRTANFRNKVQYVTINGKNADGKYCTRYAVRREQLSAVQQSNSTATTTLIKDAMICFTDSARCTVKCLHHVSLFNSAVRFFVVFGINPFCALTAVVFAILSHKSVLLFSFTKFSI